MHNIELVVVVFFFFFKWNKTTLYKNVHSDFYSFFFQGLGNTIWYFQAFQDHGKCKKKKSYKSYIMDDLRHYLTPISGSKAEIPAKSSVLV